MFDAYELQDSTPTVKRFTAAVLAALAVMAAGVVLLVVLSSDKVAEAIKPKQVDVSFRPPPPPPPPAKIENAPKPPPKRAAAPKPPPPVAEPLPVAAPAPPPPAAAAMVAPKEIPKVAAPESDTVVQAIAVAVGGTGDGSGTAVGAPGEDESPAPVVASAGTSGPVNLPEDADPPEPSEDNVAPEYPEAARTTGQEARVVLKIVVERDGHVGRIQVLKGDEPFLSAALAAVKTWTYEPARLDGEAIAVFKIVDLKFKLRSE
ncbi:MAG: TonB family protein [Myxococcota bacterium]|jgi:protein TonB